MPFLVELSGENETLPLAEVVALCYPDIIKHRSVGGRYHLFSSDNGDIVNTRAAMIHWAGNVLCEVDCVKNISNIDLGGLRFRVDVIGDVDRKGVVADIVRSVDNGVVDLTCPQARVVAHFSDKLRICVDRLGRGSFNSRNPQNRPFFSPISILPRQARALVNLSRTPDGGNLLDPMCGTGGIALEAALCGYKVMISDIDPNMVNGTIENLHHFGCSVHDKRVCPVSRISEHFSNVPGIVIDPPYGRSSTTMGKGVSALLKESFKAFTEVLLPESHLAMALPDRKLVELADPYFDTVECHEYFIHGSLSRFFTVYKLKD